MIFLKFQIDFFSYSVSVLFSIFNSILVIYDFFTWLRKDK